MKPRYFVAKPSGYYWLPGPHARALGYSNETLPTDLAAAVARAEALNAALDKTRRGEDVKQPTAEGSVDWALDLYEASDEFKEKAEKTQRSYRQCRARVTKWAGDLKPGDITKPAVKAWYKAMWKTTPAFANATIRFLRLWLGWCVEEGLIETNVVIKPKLKGTNKRDRIWTDTEIETFCTKAVEKGRESLKVAVLLARNLGQREGDILLLGDAARRVKQVRVGGRLKDRGFWLVKQSKRKAIVEVPETALLADAMKDRTATGGLVVVSEATGEPYKEDFFRHEFALVRDAAGLGDDLLFMDLRRTAVVELGRAGCTPIEIANITGHSYKTVVSILEVYLPRDSEIAANAIAKLEDYRKTSAKKRREN